METEALARGWPRAKLRSVKWELTVRHSRAFTDWKADRKLCVSADDDGMPGETGYARSKGAFVTAVAQVEGIGSMKVAPTPAADQTPAGHIRDLIAFSLCEDQVQDTDLLGKWSSLDVVEAVVVCERALGTGEIDDERLIRCRTVGDLVRIFDAT